MIAPGARVDIEKLELAVARVFFEFHFNETVVINPREQSCREHFELRLVHGFDERAGAPKIVRMLATAAADHAADGLAVLEKCAISELINAAAGNHVLDQDLIRSRHALGFSE